MVGTPRGGGELFDFDELDASEATADVEKGSGDATATELFDFDALSSSSTCRSRRNSTESSEGPCENPVADSSSESESPPLREPPKADETPVSSPLQKLRDACAKVGLTVEWCANMAQMQSMLAEVRVWEKYGIHALKSECSQRGIPLTGLFPERSEALERLAMVLVWEHLLTHQLQEECSRRRISFNPNPVRDPWVDSDDEDFDMEAILKKQKMDLIARLKQDTFPGATGPLPSRSSRPPWLQAPAPKVAWTGPPAVGAKPAAQTSAPPRPQPFQSPWGYNHPSAPDTGWQGFGPRLPTWGSSQYQFRTGSAQAPPAGGAAAESSDESGSEDELCESLGVSKTANPEAIRRAYRKMALRHHPDKLGEGGDPSEFRRISEAYEALCAQGRA